MTDSVFSVEETRHINSIKIEIQEIIDKTNAFHQKTVSQLSYSPKSNWMSECVIAGGCFASMLNDDAVKDIDIFILNNQKWIYDILKMPDGQAISSFRPDLIIQKEEGYHDNAHILGTALNTDTNVQYILTDHKSRKDLIDDFDFEHCKVSYYLEDEKLYISKKTYDCIRNKQLVPSQHRPPTLWRLKKFIHRGWTLVEKKQDMSLGKTLKDKLDNLRAPTKNPVEFNMIDPYLQTR